MLYDSYTYIFNYWRSAPIIENISKVLPIRKITNEYGKRFIQFYLISQILATPWQELRWEQIKL